MPAETTIPDEALLKSFAEEVLDKPEVFLTKSEVSAEQAKAITKYLYDLGKSAETGSLKGQGSILEELFVDGFNNDQIWEEIHMQNTPFLSYLKAEIKDIKSNKTGSQTAADEQGDGDAEGEEDEDDAEMNLGLDDEDMGLDMDDTDNMEGFSGEDEMEGSDSENIVDYNDDDDDDDDDDEEEEEEEEELDDIDLPVKKKTRTSEVDDDFFNLAEFNAMTEKQEEEEIEGKEPDEDEEEIDYFADPDLIDSGDEDDDFGDMEENENEVDAHDVGYGDFFAPLPKGTTNRPKAQRRPKNDEGDSFGKQKAGQDDDEDMEMQDAEDDEESAEVNALGDRVSNLFGADEGEAETETLSKFQKAQQKLKQQIEALEQENVVSKDWTKKGEASSADRPVNSLLEEDLEFETVAKPIPVITAETTQTLEDIIKERILAGNWDDVVRKAPPNPKAFNPSSRVEISDEKSKKSLAELYEDDYVRQTSSTGPVLSEREAALEKKHEEITTLWQDLCQKLDSLSNWHYAPKPPKAELTVVTNAPAISMEEAIPVSVADAALLAPEEIYSAGKAPVKGDTEMEQAERKRKRAQAKRAKKADIKEKGRKDAERQAEREARDRRLGRQPGDKGNSKTIVRDKMDAVKALSGQKNISFIDREGNKRSSIKGGSQAEAAKSAKLKL
ncbi:U3 small nucleolar ribonucleoprotein complex, subunit Mpp10 [Gamsiella multidivaricata]|uniref:U3 small nucleolar ribonucleoprotein complex, subunit Mpp10 n=1 Tax=Gamsiella multidivaricata TaxID=101098 RepID=UPI00222080B1|nr:U3 small nucleolar ribonucleoprotein complex, subunit Mpp10 [Gamsiella multidivaricata]KAG0370901.1 U3 snoRNP protein [Gamsiella multidivaricata]KAI7819323.1 U3 small nucleolar ribonucleoprotein complex, subunit Mpp10 [Gamsiella multidivaricata]